QAECSGGEQAGKDEVEASEPEKRDVAVTTGRADEQRRGERRHEREVGDRRVVAPLRRERREREVVSDRDGDDRHGKPRTSRDVRREGPVRQRLRASGAGGRAAAPTCRAG